MQPDPWVMDKYRFSRLPGRTCVSRTHPHERQNSKDRRGDWQYPPCLIRSSYLNRSAEIARERNANPRVFQSFPSHPRLFHSIRVQRRVLLPLNYPVPVLLGFAVAYQVHSHDQLLGPLRPIEYTTMSQSKAVSMVNKKNETMNAGQGSVSGS